MIKQIHNSLFFEQLHWLFSKKDKKCNGFLKLIKQSKLPTLSTYLWLNFELPDNYYDDFYSIAIKNPNVAAAVSLYSLLPYGFDPDLTASTIKQRGMSMQTVQELINTNSRILDFCMENYGTIQASEFLPKNFQILIEAMSDLKITDYQFKDMLPHETEILQKAFIDTMCNNPALVEQFIDEISLLSQKDQIRIAYAVTNGTCSWKHRTDNDACSTGEEFTIKGATTKNDTGTLTSTDMCCRILGISLLPDFSCINPYSSTLDSDAMRILWEHLKTDHKQFTLLRNAIIKYDMTEELDILEDTKPLPQIPDEEILKLQ